MRDLERWVDSPRLCTVSLPVPMLMWPKSPHRNPHSTVIPAVPDTWDSQILSASALTTHYPMLCVAMLTTHSHTVLSSYHNKIYECNLKVIPRWVVVVAHVFNPCTWESEAGGFLSSRPSWSTEWVPGQPGLLQRKTLSREKQNKQTNVMRHDWGRGKDVKALFFYTD